MLTLQLYRSFLFFVFWLLAILASLSYASPGTPRPAEFREVTLQLPKPHSFRYAGYYAAVKKGYYDEQGLRVIIKQGNDQTNTVDLISRQQAQYGIAGGELVYHRLTGKPVVAVAPIFQHSPWAFFIRPNSIIQSPHDFIDQTLLVSSEATSAEYLAVFKFENIPISRTTFVEGNHSESTKNNYKIFFAEVINELPPLNDHNQPYIILHPRTYGVDFYGDTLFTSETERRYHYQDILALREASFRGWQYALDHPHEIIHVIAADLQTPFSHDYLSYQAGSIRDLIQGAAGSIGHSNPGRWKHMADTFRSLDLVPQSSDLSGFVLEPQQSRFNLSTHKFIAAAVFLAILPLFIAGMCLWRHTRNKQTIGNNSSNPPDDKRPLNITSLDTIGVLGFNEDKNIIYWNNGAEKLFGYTATEAHLVPVDKLILPVGSKEEFETACNTDKSSNRVPFSIILRKNNDEMIQTCCVFIQANNNHTYAILFDITPFINSPLKQRESEERYHFLFETMPEGFALHEMIYDGRNEPIDYRFITVNPAFEKITGYRAQNVIGRTIGEVHPHFDRRWLKRYESVAATGKAAKFIDHTTEADKYFEIAAFSPKKNYFACFFNDITEKKNIDDRISYQAFLLDHVRNGIAVTAIDGRLKYWNKSAENLYQYSAEEVIGKPLDKIVAFDYQSASSSAAQNSKRYGGWKGEFIQNRKDKSQFTAQLAKHRIPDDTGQVIAHLYVIEDISKQKELQGLVNRYHNMQTISTLARSITHAFNNTLSAILGYTEIAQEDIPDNTPGKSSLEKIFEAGYQARNLVSQIMYFDRICEKEYTSLDIATVISDALALVKISISHHINIIEKINSQCGTIQGSAVQIYQLVLSLSSFCIEEMAAGGGALCLTLSEKKAGHTSFATTASDPYVVLAIHSKRCKKPPHHQQITGADRNADLTFAQTIIDQHGGHLEYDRPSEREHLFSLFFPALSKKVSAQHQSISVPARGQESVLIIDDEVPIVEITARLLRGLGYKVTAVSQSTAALDLFKKEPYSFDLVITDQTMPNLTGSELIKHLHQIRPELPVIIYTGYIQRIDNNLCENLDIKEVLTKPVTKTELAQKVRSVLDSCGSYSHN